ncbi:hypothetical protein B484DRAFT_434390, partial [Ochromonadaceae sp. CCMP2298]
LCKPLGTSRSRSEVEITLQCRARGLRRETRCSSRALYAFRRSQGGSRAMQARQSTAERYGHPALDDNQLESQDWKDLTTGQSVAYTGEARGAALPGTLAVPQGHQQLPEWYREMRKLL